MKKGVFIAILIGGLGLIWAGVVRAHGKGEIEIFAYLLEEEGFFRLAAGLVGLVFTLMGLYIAWQGNRVWAGMAESGEAPDTSQAKMMAPGAIFAAVGATIIFAAIFILPDKVDVGGHHPGDGVKMPEKK